MTSRKLFLGKYADLKSDSTAKYVADNYATAKYVADNYATAKYVADQFSEHIKNYPHSSGGGGSVIDGTVLTNKSSIFSSCLTGKSNVANVYKVENDCALYLGYSGDLEKNNKLVFYINGSTVVSLNSNAGTSATEEGAGSIIHVKKGVVIQASVSAWNSSTKKCMMEFIEYKLS